MGCAAEPIAHQRATKARPEGRRDHKTEGINTAPPLSKANLVQRMFGGKSPRLRLEP